MYNKIDLAATQAERHDIGALDFLPGPRNTDLLDFIVSIAQAGGINHVQRNTFDLQGAAHHITGRSGDWRDNRQVVTGQTVEQTGFADIRLPGQDHMQAALQQPALLGTVKNLSQTLLQTIESAKGIGRFEKIDLFLGKIESRLDQCAQFRQLLKQRIDFL